MRDLLAGVDRQRLIDRFGVSADAWCDRLPDLVGQLTSRWRLEVDALLPAGSNSVVLCCGTSVLKLTPDPQVAIAEEAALRAWADCRHIVALIDADADRGAVLLEAVRPGTPLAADPAGWSLEDIAPVLIELGDVAVPVGAFESLTARVEVVFDLFEARLGRWPAVAARVSTGVLARSRALAAELGGAGEIGLLHGDLHPGNVLRGAGRSIAIDPRPCLGHRACDAVDWALADVVDERDLDRRIDALTALVHGLDGTRLRAWCVAFAVVVAASLLNQRPDDPVGEFALRLASDC